MIDYRQAWEALKVSIERFKHDEEWHIADLEKQGHQNLTAIGPGASLVV